LGMTNACRKAWPRSSATAAASAAPAAAASTAPTLGGAAPRHQHSQLRCRAATSCGRGRDVGARALPLRPSPRAAAAASRRWRGGARLRIRGRHGHRARHRPPYAADDGHHPRELPAAAHALGASSAVSTPGRECASRARQREPAATGLRARLGQRHEDKDDHEERHEAEPCRREQEWPQEGGQDAAPGERRDDELVGEQALKVGRLHRCQRAAPTAALRTRGLWRFCSEPGQVDSGTAGRGRRPTPHLATCYTGRSCVQRLCQRRLPSSSLRAARCTNAFATAANGPSRSAARQRRITPPGPVDFGAPRVSQCCALL